MAKSNYRSWYHWPIRILGKNPSLEELLKNERQLIHWLQPTLNHKKRGRLRNCFLEPITLGAKKDRPGAPRCIHKKNKICRPCKDLNNYNQLRAYANLQPYARQLLRLPQPHDPDEQIYDGSHTTNNKKQSP